MPNVLYLSPNFTTDNFPRDPHLDDQIRLFTDRVLGWQLRQAEHMLEHKHSGFAVLLVATAYFEMFARLRAGDTSTTNASEAFHTGLRAVFPEFEPEDEKRLLRDLRGGLYHTGMTGPSILLTEDFPEAIVHDFWEGSPVVRINPRTFVQRIMKHFEEYVSSLHDPANVKARDNFQKYFFERVTNVEGKRPRC